MKIIFSVVLSVSILLATHTFQISASEKSAPLYTAHNIWKHSKNYMYCINYKSASSFIPAGTKVENTRVVKRRKSHGDGKTSLITYIEFRLAGSGKIVAIRVRKELHPGRKAEDYLSYMFTHKDFSNLTDGFTDDEIDGIKMGKLYQGMRKQAVIISYGYPPEHETKDLNNDLWTYWVTTTKTKDICFDENNRAMHCAFRKEL